MRQDASEEIHLKTSTPRRDGFLTVCTLTAVLVTVIAMVRWPA
ncbi:protein of unknown function (plasmid) [Cupriavidus taiwanensis]|nr:protein of unknown function [Cupriavidus taiwanensis]